MRKMPQTDDEEPPIDYLAYLNRVLENEQRELIPRQTGLEQR
jgi:hypothetical protein